MIAHYGSGSGGRLAAAAGVIVLVAGIPTLGLAQRPPGQPAQSVAQAPQASPQQTQSSADPVARPPQPAGAAPPRWDSFAPMVLERVFRGPLQDTLVQRWRDPNDGAVCFVYLPISAAAAGQGSYLIYGPNTIGSISCYAPAQIIQIHGTGVSAPASSPQAPGGPAVPSAPAPPQPPRGR